MQMLQPCIGNRLTLIETTPEYTYTCGNSWYPGLPLTERFIVSGVDIGYEVSPT